MSLDDNFVVCKILTTKLLVHLGGSSIFRNSLEFEIGTPL